MASATGHKGQETGLGLRLELVHGPGGPQARLHAGPAVLAPGLRLAALVAEPAPAAALEDEAAPRPGLAATTSGSLSVALRAGPWRALEVRLEVTAEGLARACAGLRGQAIGGWPIDQVSAELAGERAVLMLAGPGDEGWPGLVQIELAFAVDGEAVRVRASRVWATAPLAAAGPGLCAALAGRLAEAWPGAVKVVAGGVRVDPGWLVRRAFLSAGARPPRTGGLRPAHLRAQGRSLRLLLSRAEVSKKTGSKGHVDTNMSDVPGDPLAELRAALRAGDRARALAELERAAVPTYPGARRMTAALARVRASLLRFVDPDAAAAVRAWLAAAPDDPEAWWQVTVQRGRAGDAEGVIRGLVALERAGGPPEATLLRRAARAMVQIERLGRRWEERFGDMSKVTCPEAQAAMRRAIALARAADPAVSPGEVAVAVQEVLADRRTGGRDGEELCARVAAVATRAGRDARATALLMRRIGVEAPAIVDTEAEVDSLVAVADALARRGALSRLDAIVEATGERVGRAALTATLQARCRAWPPPPGVVLALASLAERTCDSETGGALMQVAAFMLPGAGIATAPVRFAAAEDGASRAVNGSEDGSGPEDGASRAVSGGREDGSPRGLNGGATEDERPRAASVAPEDMAPAVVRGPEDDESRAAIVAVLRGMVAETGGIRAPGARPGPPEMPQAAAAQAEAEAELGPLRAVLGLRLPVRVGRGGGPIGGVGIRNEREPAIVIYPALAELPPVERRFRLALAAVLVRAGLAVVLDPAGASLHELLAALAHLAEPAVLPALPGARTIAGVWARRGITGERLPVPLRTALGEELRRWRQDEAHVARLAARLREDTVAAAVRLTGALDGALWAIARDARMPVPVDEASARVVLASAPARRLLDRLGLFGHHQAP